MRLHKLLVTMETELESCNSKLHVVYISEAVGCWQIRKKFGPNIYNSYRD